jgi:hypothetical protein
MSLAKKTLLHMKKLVLNRAIEQMKRLVMSMIGFFFIGKWRLGTSFGSNHTACATVKGVLTTFTYQHW